MISVQSSIAMLGIAICAVGAFAGRRFTSLRVWMAVSACIGLSGMCMWCHGVNNQVAGNSWVLLNVIVLLPYLSVLCMDSLKPVIYALIAVCAWLFFATCINTGITAYAPGLRVAVSLSIAAACALAAFKGQNCVLLVTLCSACMLDAVLYSFSLEWFRFNPPHGMWAGRNILWCGVYLAMGYTVRRR